MVTQFEVTGRNLENALAGLQTRRRSLDHFTSWELEISIFRRTEAGETRVANVKSGRSYQHALRVAEGVAALNTGEYYRNEHPDYRTEVTVRGYY